MDQATETNAVSNAVQSFLQWLTDANLQALATAAFGLLLVVLLRKPLSSLAVLIIEKVLGALSITLSEQMRREFNSTMRVILVASAALLALDATNLPAFFGGVLTRLLVSVLVLSVFSAWYRLIGPFVAVLDPKKFTDLTLDTSWIVRFAQFVVVLLAITALLAVWDIDISSALTGVGVFGAGIAIAAQDFVRNLFAGMTNISEKRFAPGDWIAVEGGVEGIVSRVDVRSTTILGFDRIPRYVPNADLSNAIILNKTRMDHRRIYWVLPLTLDATDAQVGQVCAALNSHLAKSGDFVDDGSLFMTAAPVGFSDSSLDVMIYAFTRSSAYKDYLNVSGRLTLAVRQAVKDAGTALAYPTQTVFVNQTAGAS